MTAWAWVNGMLVTALPDGRIPLNSKVVLANNRETDELDVDEKAMSLIAAAPELLAALEQYHRSAKAIPYSQWSQTQHMAAAAIAKARGE